MTSCRKKRRTDPQSRVAARKLGINKEVCFEKEPKAVGRPSEMRMKQ